MKNFSLITCLVFLLITCKSESTSDLPVTVSAALNTYVASAPFQRIIIDDIPPQKIQLKEEDFIYNTYINKPDNEPIISQITNFTYLNDRFYVYDRRSEAIFVIKLNGYVSGPYTQAGDGPGEHRFAGAIRSNSEFIYLMDINSSRINRYSPEMEIKDPLTELRVSLGANIIDLNEEKILYSNQKSSGFVPENEEEGLIVISQTNNLTDTIRTMLPRIVPPGYQPNVYNTPIFSINQQSNIAAGYQPLPWVFIHNENFELERTLIFEYSVFEGMDIPELEFFRPIGNEGYGGAMPFSQIKLMDNGDLFLSIKKELIHLRQDKNGAYRLIGKYHFISELEDSAIWIADIYLGGVEGEFYAGNWNYLFKFYLP